MQQSNNTVSVVIPTFNRRHTLERALHSVYAQTRIPEEVIVVDDGSVDDTGSMVTTKFPQVRYFYQPNLGVSAARNFGIGQVRGAWIALLDSDDEWLPAKLEKQLNALNNAPGSQVCHSDEIWNRNGKRVNQMLKHAKSGGWIFKQCLPLCAISPSAVVLHRTLFDQVGLFDESLPACEDYDFWLRVCAQLPVLFIAEPLIIKYGGHADQLSRKYWGMDRFRIQALAKIIRTQILQEDDQNAALTMLKEKVTIYIQGAAKRGKHGEVAHYQAVLKSFGLLDSKSA
jgi:glycosyltransferase involved in cell wall biosynthesis